MRRIIISGMPRSGTRWVSNVFQSCMNNLFVEGAFWRLAHLGRHTGVGKEVLSTGETRDWLKLVGKKLLNRIHRLLPNPDSYFYPHYQVDKATVYEQVEALFDALDFGLPDVLGMKVLAAPYYNLYRSRWPDHILLHVDRSTLGQLNARVRAGWVRDTIAHPGVAAFVEAFACQHEDRDVAWTAALVALSRRLYLSMLPADAFVIEYDSLVCDWDVVWPTIFRHCNVSPPETVYYCPTIDPSRIDRTHAAHADPTMLYTLARCAEEYVATSDWPNAWVLDL